MNPKKFIDEFTSMIAVLQKDKQKELIHYSINPPAQYSIITSIKERFEDFVPRSFFDLYTIANGLHCTWDSLNSNSVKSPKISSFKPLTPIFNEWYHDGCINILPLEEIFNEENWKGQVWFDGDAKYEGEFVDGRKNLLAIKKSIFPFDLFSTVNCTAFYISKKDKTCPFFFTQDYYVDFNSSFLTDFETYLEFLIYSKGEIQKRKKVFNKPNGYKEPWKKIDELIQ
jgi:hypothetical protein